MYITIQRVLALFKSRTASRWSSRPSLKLEAKVLHQKIVTLGLQRSIPLSKGLIDLYISCQDFQSAKLVFQNLENPLDITLWNGLMAAYTGNSVFNEALELFQKLLLLSPYLKPDGYTYPSVLKACGGLGGRMECGRTVHASVVKTGFVCDVVVASSVVGMYGRGGDFESAAQVFDEMPVRDVACWNTLISCYYQSGECAKTLELFGKMKESGYMPNSVSYTAAISSCARLLDLDRGERIYGELVRNGIVLDGFICAALVDMYGKCGHIEKAKEVFERIPHKSLVNWNAMIAGYSLRGDSKSCIELLLRMNEEDVQPSLTTLSSLLMACSRSAQLQHGKFVHAYIIRRGIEPDMFVQCSLVDLYFKCGRVENAKRIFSTTPKGDVTAWNTMISGLVSAGNYLEALDIYSDMKMGGIKYNAITFTSILVACSQLAALEQGKEVHKRIIESKLDSSEIVMGALLDMYAKCGAVSEAYEVFHQLPERDIVSWTSMIVAYGSHGQASEALRLFHEMLQSNVKPDKVTFLAVISACSHAGLVDEGCHYFNLMVTDYGIKPSIEDYSCLLDLLGRAGRLNEAYAILQRSPYMREDVSLLSTLFSACHMHREEDIGEEVAKLLIQKGSDDPSTYVILANMFATRKKWNKALDIRMRMKELGLRKNPGCSWIEVDKRIHTFLADDQSFPEAETVYECLNKINYHINKYEMLDVM
nr:pentatricopeptide repeat-containing protein At5g27110 [Ipomoea batatas]